MRTTTPPALADTTSNATPAAGLRAREAEMASAEKGSTVAKSAGRTPHGARPELTDTPTTLLVGQATVREARAAAVTVASVTPAAVARRRASSGVNNTALVLLSFWAAATTTLKYGAAMDAGTHESGEM